jgi:hypothetical protein
MSDVITITPGAGSFTDPSGNVYTIDAANYDTAEINGQPITPNGESTNTGAMELSNGSVYGQDQISGQWYLLAPKGTSGLWEWQPVSAPPGASTGTSSENFVLSPGGTTTAALGSDQAAIAFVGGGGSDVTGANPSVTNTSSATGGLLTPDDFRQSTSGSPSTADPSQGTLQATPDATGGTMLAVGAWHSTDPQGVTAVPTSH